MHFAARGGSLAIVNMLLARGVSPTSITQSGTTPLYVYYRYISLY